MLLCCCVVVGIVAFLALFAYIFYNILKFCKLKGMS